MNSSIKAYLDDPMLQNDPHKCAIIWSSKAYRNINSTLRSEKTLVNLDRRRFKYTIRFLDDFLWYFKSHGVHQDSLINDEKCKTLYRGFDSYPFTSDVRDYGFISTSRSKAVADSFARKEGVVINFSTRKLPKTVPFVLIGNRIRDYLLEQEVLFLPGTIQLNGLKATYSVDPEVYQYMLLLNQSGGALLQSLKIPTIDLKGKYVVWWRAIVDRPVEIMRIVKLPKTSDIEVIRFWRKCIDARDMEFEQMNKFIPVYQDLFNKKHKTNQDRKVMNSYNAHMAIYDAKQKKVEHYHYGVFDELAAETDYDPLREKELDELLSTQTVLQ